jgi:hypothetical protein
VIPIHTAKLLLALVGVAVFLAASRFGLPWLRWAGIALVTIAWLLRFYRPRSR